MVVCAILSHFFLQESLTFFVSARRYHKAASSHRPSGLDRLRPVYPWCHNISSQRSGTAIRHHDRPVQATLHRPWLSRLDVSLHRSIARLGLLRRAAMGKDQHDAPYKHLQSDRRYQRELYARFGFEYRDIDSRVSVVYVL